MMRQIIVPRSGQKRVGGGIAVETKGRGLLPGFGQPGFGQNLASRRRRRGKGGGRGRS